MPGTYAHKMAILDMLRRAHAPPPRAPRSSSPDSTTALNFERYYMPTRPKKRVRFDEDVQLLDECKRSKPDLAVPDLTGDTVDESLPAAVPAELKLPVLSFTDEDILLSRLLHWREGDRGFTIGALAQTRAQHRAAATNTVASPIACLLALRREDSTS